MFHVLQNCTESTNPSSEFVKKSIWKNVNFGVSPPPFWKKFTFWFFFWDASLSGIRALWTNKTSDLQCFILFPDSFFFHNLFQDRQNSGNMNSGFDQTYSLVCILEQWWFLTSVTEWQFSLHQSTRETVFPPKKGYFG